MSARTSGFHRSKRSADALSSTATGPRASRKRMRPFPTPQEDLQEGQSVGSTGELGDGHSHADDQSDASETSPHSPILPRSNFVARQRNVTVAVSLCHTLDDIDQVIVYLRIQTKSPSRPTSIMFVFASII